MSFVIPTEVEESLNILPDAARVQFLGLIMTNKLDSVIYIGMTNDLERRVIEHQSGEIPGFTTDYRCHKLIYWEHYSYVDDAIAREEQLKNWSRKKKVALIESMNPRWIDLSEEIFGNI